MKGIPVSGQDARALLRGDQVHLGYHPERAKAKRVNLAARAEGGRVGEIDISGADGEDDVGLADVFVAEGGDLLFEALGLVEGGDLDVAWEVDEGEVGNVGGVYSQVDWVAGNSFGGGNGEIEVNQNSLDVREVGELPKTQSREFAIFARDFSVFSWRMDKSKFNRSTSNHIIAPARVLSVSEQAMNILNGHTLAKIDGPQSPLTPNFSQSFGFQ